MKLDERISNNNVCTVRIRPHLHMQSLNNTVVYLKFRISDILLDPRRIEGRSDAHTIRHLSPASFKTDSIHFTHRCLPAIFHCDLRVSNHYLFVIQTVRFIWESPSELARFPWAQGITIGNTIRNQIVLQWKKKFTSPPPLGNKL